MISKSKKTLLVTLHYPPQKGGIENYLHTLVDHMESPPTILCLEHKQAKEFDSKYEKINVIRIKKSNYQLLNIFWLMISFLKIKKNNFNHLICGHLYLSPIGFLANIFFNTRYSVFFYGMEISNLHSNNINIFTKFFFKCFLSKASIFWAITNFTKSEVSKLSLRHIPICVINPAIQSKKFEPTPASTSIDPRKELGIDKNSIIILTVARLVERKGHAKILNAISFLKQKNFSLHYLIVGDGPQKQFLEDLTKGLNLQNNVSFIGEIEDSQLLSYYNACDIFAMTNLFLPKRNNVEGFGIVFIEASYLGKCVLGGNSGGVPDAILDGQTGLLTNTDSIDDVINKLELLIGHKELREKLGAQGKEWVSKNFNPKFLSNKFETTLRDFL